MKLIMHISFSDNQCVNLKIKELDEKHQENLINCKIQDAEYS